MIKKTMRFLLVLKMFMKTFSCIDTILTKQIYKFIRYYSAVITFPKKLGSYPHLITMNQKHMPLKAGLVYKGLRT